jgi:tetratricopeptide (TPR) repeat protein
MARGLDSIKPVCPFCDAPLDRPRDMEPKRLGDFGYGRCDDCGAVYVHDVTGFNLGAALVEALGFACNDNWDMAWDLMPDDDYQDVLIEHYDENTHRIYPSGHDNSGNRVKGALSFIRLLDDVREVTDAGVKQRLEEAPEPAQPLSKPRRKTGKAVRFSKREVQKAVAARQLTQLISMALRDPLVLRKIQRLLYSADENQRWNAVLMLGGVAGALAKSEQALVGDLVRRMLYAANDSAAANWGTIEVIGEIIRRQPSVYGSFVRHILGLLHDRPSRPAILWSLGRIGELYPKLVKSASFFPLLDFLESEDPLVRGHAVWALGRMQSKEALTACRRLCSDTAELSLFDGEIIRNTTVGELALEAVNYMEADASSKDETGGKMKEGENQVQEQNAQVADNPRIIQARTMYQEADILKNRGQSLDALDKFEQVLAIFDEENCVVEVANVSEKIGDLHIMRGNFQAALSPYQRTLAICEKYSDTVSTVIILEKIIDVYRQLKEWEKVLPYYFRALELVEELREVKRSALFLAGIGDVFERLGQREDALDAYVLAEKLYRNMGARQKADVLAKGIEQLRIELGENA